MWPLQGGRGLSASAAAGPLEPFRHHAEVRRPCPRREAPPPQIPLPHLRDCFPHSGTSSAVGSGGFLSLDPDPWPDPAADEGAALDLALVWGAALTGIFPAEPLVP